MASSLIVIHEFTHSSGGTGRVRVDLGQWMDEAVEFAEREADALDRRRDANIAAARARRTCAVGHPFLVYVGPTREDRFGSTCGYCDSARHE